MSKLDVLKDMTGGQMADQILQGKVAITVADIIAKFFDKNGRGIPENLEASVCNPNTDYKVTQPDVLSNGFLAAGFERAENHLGDYLGRGMISFSDYQTQVTALVEKLKADEAVANLLKGPWLPIVIPQMVVEDLGKTTETMAEIAGESYKAAYPDRVWNNYRKGELFGNVTLAEGTRHGRLISSIAEESVVGIYFSDAMQGFSVHAQSEFEQRLPETFSLTGAIEPAVALTMYPTVLAHSNKTPGYDCSALRYRSTERSLNFRALDAELWFGDWGNLGGANDDFSGGLLFFG